MRIGLIVPWLEAGGVETFLFRLAAFLTGRNHDVEIIATECEGAWFSKARERGFRCTCYPEAEAFSVRAQAALVGRKLAARNFDVCLLNHARMAQASLAMLNDRTIAIPVIHNDHPSVYAVGCANNGAWNVAVGVSHKVSRQTKAMVVERPVVEIPYGVELRLLPPPCAAGSKPFRIAFVGRLLHAHKGVLLLPDILADCRKRGADVRLSIVGDGEDRELLEQKLCMMGLTEHVEFHGLLAPEEVGKRLVQFDVLIMPSFFEGLGIVLLEAMACGCVPVVSKLEGVTDRVVMDGETGFLASSGDSRSFADAIERLYLQPELRRRMSEAARGAIERNYSVETMGAAYLDLFARAMGGGYALPKSRRIQPSLDTSLFRPKEWFPNRLRRMYSRTKQTGKRLLRAY